MRIASFALVLTVAPAACGDGGGFGGRSSGPEGAIEDTILTWLLEGDCDVMTDQFLEDQVLGTGDSRAENCEIFEDAFIEKQYDADDVEISGVERDGSTASAVVGDDFSNVESTYELVNEDGRWRIDSVDIS